jgi:opacity protein-like surface antigen
MRKSVLILSCIALLSVTALAQRNELAVVAGVKITPSVGSNSSVFGKTNVDTSFAVEGNYAATLAHVPFVALQLEFPVIATPRSNVTSNLTRVDNYSSLYFTPSLRLKVAPGAPVSPWISAGAGIVHFSPHTPPNNVALPAGVTLPPAGTSSTKAAYQVGAGLDFKPGLLPLAFRLQARELYTGLPDFGSIKINIRNNVMVGAGVVFRF